MYIKDGSGQPVYAIGGPYDEDSELRLTCVVENGIVLISPSHCMLYTLLPVTHLGPFLDITEK